MIILGEKEDIKSKVTQASSENQNIIDTIDAISNLAELKVVLKKVAQHMKIMNRRIAYLEEQLGEKL